MVRWMVALVVVLVLAARFEFSVAGEAPGNRPLSPETAAIFSLQPAEDKEAEDAEESDDGKEGDESPAKDEDAKDDEDDESNADEKASDAEPTKADAEEEEEKDEEKSESAKKPAKADAKGTKKPAEEAKADAAESDEKKASEKKEEKKPETYKVKTKDLKIDVETEGVFVAEELEEVALRPEVWSSFKVVEAVPHGKRVRKGDVLVKFDDKDVDEALEKQELQLRISELALMEAEEEFPRLEKSIELNYEQAKRSFEQSTEEKERFEKTMRELSERLAEYYLKSAEQDLNNATEELEQLQKMYDADELTEETEEIVLKRQKFQVEAAKFFMEYSKINHDYTVNISIPRRAEALETAVEMSKIDFDRAKMAKSLGLNQQRYELQTLRESRAKSVEDNAKLVEDRQLMELKAPADGIAYYGRQVNGRWIEVGSLESKLIPFGQVSPNSVVMTIVKDRPLYVETSIGEKELPTVKDYQSTVVAPAADSEVELKGKVKTVATVPGAGNKFAVRVDLEDQDKMPQWLMPGMTGKAKITTYDVADAVVIPADLVQADEDDDKKKYVMLQVEDEEKPVRRDVKLGKAKDKEVEVLKGLEEGDEIVKGAKDDAEKDEDEKKNAEKE